MKIIIYSQNLVSMDGVGNSSIYFMNSLKSFADVELVAHYSNINGVTNFNEYFFDETFLGHLGAILGTYCLFYSY